MCGIAGVFEYQGRFAVHADTLRRMTDAVCHRGPDDSGEFMDDALALGMRRLSIIDLEGGKQPIANESGEIIVVFNGEIYNYRELREQLVSSGHVLKTMSDTEVIVHLYEEQGEDCVLTLRGMFGFALWDASERKLMLARDRLGIKPLYYADINGTLVFGSEIKSILQHPAVFAQLNHQALSDFLSLKYVPSPETLFDNIHAVPPGFMLVCTAQGVRLRRYWDLRFSEEAGGDEAACAERLEALLRESVLLHLRSDVPFGAFLSGGLDSSTIVALMASYLDQPVETFSIGFSGEGSAMSETRYARQVAEYFGTRHHELIIEAADFVGSVERVVWHLDQPVADLACFANMMLAESASRHVKMVLTGEGGDELFAGYARYSGERLSPAFKLMPGAAKRVLIRGSERIPGQRRAKLALNALAERDEARRLLAWFPLFNDKEKSRLLTGDVWMYTGCAPTDRVISAQLGNAGSAVPLSRMLYVDTKLWLPDDLLARGDKMSMAASIEARVPLLDHKVVEFAASLPSHLKIHTLTRKYLFRKLAQKLLPREIVHRKKQGFPIPISLWFRSEARQFVSDLLAPDTIRRRGLFDVSYVQSLLREHMSGTADRSAQLWALAMVELWHVRFIDEASTGKATRLQPPPLRSPEVVCQV
jgi:asparagine synthase (glutamine-hydrolysing)